MKEFKIAKKDFYEFTGKGRTWSISGRPKGEAIRGKWNLDELEKEKGTIIYISIPEKMYNISPSLIQGMFTQTIKEIKKKGFYEKYKFLSPNLILLDQIIKVIEDLDRKFHKEDYKA
jgi:uncharacterized protein YdhG (YjbR/CyaY superfamily)